MTVSTYDEMLSHNIYTELHGHTRLSAEIVKKPIITTGLKIADLICKYSETVRSFLF